MSDKSRRTLACLKACQGLSTAALETAGDKPVLALITAAVNTNVYCRELNAGGGPLFDAVRALEEVPNDGQ